MAAEDRPRRMSVDEWRAIERAGHDVKHEYIDGYVYAMAGGTLAHARIAYNAASALEAALGDGPCITYTQDAAVQLSESRFTYPDVVVTCEEGRSVARRQDTEVTAPRVVFEVLSNATEQYDRTLKFAYYRECPSLQEYVPVNTAYQAVEVYRRTADGWGVFQIVQPGEQVVLASIAASIAVDALYRRTDVPAEPPDPQPAGARAVP